MYEINFKYKGQDNIIKCKESKLLIDVCKEFAKKQNLDFDNIFFIHDEEKLNLSLNLYVGQQFGPKYSENNERIEIFVFKENAYSIIFKYGGSDYIINVKLTDKMKDVISKFKLKANIDLQNIYFNYSGNILEIEDETVDNIITQIDRKEKAMSILVMEIERVTMSSFGDKRESLLPKNFDEQDDHENNDENNNMNNNNINIIINQNNNENDLDMNNVQEQNNDEHIAEQNMNQENVACIKDIKCRNYIEIKPIVIISVQLFIILLFGFIGLSCRWEIDVDSATFLGIFVPLVNLVFYMTINLLCHFPKNKNEYESKLWIIYHILFIPFMIPVCYLKGVQKLVLSILSIVFLGVISILIFRPKKRWLMIIILISSNIISVPLFYFTLSNNTLLNDTTFLIIIASSSIGFDIYFFVVSCMADQLCDDNNLYPIILFDYGVPMVYFFLAFAIFYYPIKFYKNDCNQ